MKRKEQKTKQKKNIKKQKQKIKKKKTVENKNINKTTNQTTKSKSKKNAYHVEKRDNHFIQLARKKMQYNNKKQKQGKKLAHYVP